MNFFTNHNKNHETNTGDSISVPTSTVNGIDMGYQEWCDYLFLHYGIEHPDLPLDCDRYGALFLINHALDLKKSAYAQLISKSSTMGLLIWLTRPVTLVHAQKAPHIPMP